MSALAGRWNFDGNPEAGASCKRMLAAQEMYGPDDGRQWSDGPIAIGRRLFRTVPEDKFDRQPLLSADGRLAFVADVRLDNRSDLGEALGLSDGALEQLSDAAVLFACIERWGENALDRLVGDFAFALWDAGARRLLLARDFLGQRPLHYHRGKGFFAFATMPKGLHALPDIPYAPDEQAMAEFVTLIPEGGGRSFFKDIAVVEPGHCVTVTREGVEARRYWAPRRQDLARSGREDFAEGLRHHLDLATRARLRGAGGTVGAHLSGGYDSAAVTATAARLLGGSEGGKVVAFTAVPRQGYDGPVPRGRIADEGPLAAATAAMYPNIEHVLIRSGHVSPLEAIDRNFYLYERPTLNLCNETWMSSIGRAARDRKLSVLLTGQMGNMSLSYAGIELMPELLRNGRLIHLWRVAAGAVARGTLRWPAVAANTFGPYLPSWLWKFSTKLAGRAWDVTEYTAIRPERLDRLDLQGLSSERGLDFTYRPRRDGFETRLWVLRRISLGNYNKGMLAGWRIDQRDPTADKRLVEYCLGVPMDEYLDRGETRALARRALRDRLPRAVLDAQGKGYQAADWHEGLSAARSEIEAEVDRFAQCAPAAAALDVVRLRAMLDKWPESGWAQTPTRNAYRLALLRGVSAGHFLRKASGANQ